MTVARYVCRCCSLAAMCLSGRISLYNILSKLIDVSVVEDKIRQGKIRYDKMP